jgi:iron(III) transport system ATP-binding protein
LSNLDARLRQELRAQLKELQQHVGITTVYVTHDQDEALALSDRLAVMNGGRIEHLGTPEDVYERPATEFVCTFLGEANLLPPALVEQVGGPRSGRTYVRPELVRLLGDDERTPSWCSGVVRDRTYHGASVSCSVDVGPGSTVHVVVPRGGRRAPTVGDEVRVVFPLQHLLTYADGAPAGASPVAAS